MSTSVMYTMEGEKAERGAGPCSYALRMGHDQLITKAFHRGPRGTRGEMRRFEGKCTAKADDLPSLSVT